MPGNLVLLNFAVITVVEMRGALGWKNESYQEDLNGGLRVKRSCWVHYPLYPEFRAVKKCPCCPTRDTKTSQLWKHKPNLGGKQCYLAKMKTNRGQEGEPWDWGLDLADEASCRSPRDRAAQVISPRVSSATALLPPSSAFHCRRDVLRRRSPPGCGGGGAGGLPRSQTRSFGPEPGRPLPPATSLRPAGCPASREVVAEQEGRRAGRGGPSDEAPGRKASLSWL